MKKVLKVGLITLVVLMLLFLSFLVVWVFILFPCFFSPVLQEDYVTPGPVEIAEESENIDLNTDNGVLYVSNEVIVFLRDTATQNKIDALFQDYEATVDDTMADLLIYKLVFRSNMEYDELEAVVSDLQSKAIVEFASINPVTTLEGDSDGNAESFQKKNPSTPDDPWNGVIWNTQVPGGSNWGVEAIDAPGAWGYMSQMRTVNVGLIDTQPDTTHADLRDGFVTSNSLFLDTSNGSVRLNISNVTPNSHGSHVSGIINASWNNHEGISGVMGGKGRLYHTALYRLKNGKAESDYATAYTYLLCLKNLIDQDVQAINISQNSSRLIGFAASHGNSNAIQYLSLQANLTQKGLSRIITSRQKANKPDFVLCVAAGNSNSTYYYKDDKATYGYREEMTDWECIKYLFGWRGEIGNSQALYNNFLNLMNDSQVRDRVVVVGSIGIEANASTDQKTRYCYSSFSNVGNRVDIVAPGEDIYSCIPGGYENMSGTSMSTPHVTGVAGLVFASNPSLTGPQVKQILLSSATGRYYHGDSFSGLLNANQSVVNALKTVKTPVNRVLRTEVDDGLDLCFVVDTTGSMGDDIQNAKENMARILEHLANKTHNYRVALIDYRDYPSRSYDSRDYPYHIQLQFSENNDAIINAINHLDLGDGGDNAETVYSALMAATRMDWREDAKKVIIILGDAPPLDPEPETGYTYEKVIFALLKADIGIDLEHSDDEVIAHLENSFINVYSIGTDASDEASNFFRKISAGTGGTYSDVRDASQVGDVIISSIEQIEVAETVTVNADFGDALAGCKISIYSGADYLFTFETDENGRCVLESMPTGTYRWNSDSLYSSGDIVIQDNNQNATTHMTAGYWFTPLMQIWYQQRLLVVLALLGYFWLCLAFPATLVKCLKKVRKSWDKNGRKSKAARSSSTDVRRGRDPNRNTSIGASQLCPSCGKPNPNSALFCQYCGYNLKEQHRKETPGFCKKCGQPYGPKDKFCTICGEIIRRN